MSRPTRRALEDAVNGQLVRWLVDFNFGPDVEAPRWTIDTTRDDALERDLAIDKDLIAAGVALPEKYFYEKYQRPAPTGGESALRYDDKDLFQYHLRYGVLTINEARARAWGFRPWRGAISARFPSLRRTRRKSRTVHSAGASESALEQEQENPHKQTRTSSTQRDVGGEACLALPT